MAKLESIFREIKLKIADDKLDDALGMLQVNLNLYVAYEKEIIALQKRLQEHKLADIRTGSESFEDLTISKRNIVDDLLKLLSLITLSPEIKTRYLSDDINRTAMIRDVKGFIDNHSNQIKYYSKLTAVVLLIGIVGTALSFVIPFSVEQSQDIVLYGSVLISLCSGIPIREVLNRREKIGTLNVLKNKVSQSSSEDELKQAKDLILRIFEKTAI